MSHFLCNFGKIVQKLPKKIPNSLHYSYQHVFEIPQKYETAFHLANASFHDNVNWFYYNAIEKSFEKLVHEIKSPNISDEQADLQLKNILHMVEFGANFYDVRFPIKKANGEFEMVFGYCVQHGSHYPIHLGGIRIDPDLEKPHMRALATLSTLKHSLANVPYSGCFCGLKCDPQRMTRDEYIRTLATFISRISRKGFIGPKLSVYEPDLNCNQNTMGFIAEEISKSTGTEENISLSSVTGKSVGKEGLPNFENTISMGMFHSINNFLNNDKYMSELQMNFNAGWKDKTFIIQGYGRLGIQISEILCQMGAKCVGVCDLMEEKVICYYSKDGLDMKKFKELKLENGSIQNSATKTDAKTFLAKECDVLLVSACHKSITCFNAPEIQAKIVLEAAYGGLTPSAHKILLAKGKLIIPDLFINAVSSLASEIEHFQNCKEENAVLSTLKLGLGRQTSFKFKESEIYKQDIVTPSIQYKMKDISEKISKTATDFELGLDIKTAAYIIAIQNIIQENLKYKVLV